MWSENQVVTDLEVGPTGSAMLICMALDTKPTCVRIGCNDTYRGKQGLEYFAGVSAETAGAKGLCLHLVTIPPGGRAKPHLHENHESAVYVVSGKAGMWYCEGLREHVWTYPG